MKEWYVTITATLCISARNEAQAEDRAEALESAFAEGFSPTARWAKSIEIDSIDHEIEEV